MSPQRLGFPQVSQGPWKSEAAPLPGITRRLLVVAARGRSSREGRVGTVPLQIPPDVRSRQEMRRKKLQGVRDKERPFSLFSPLPFCLSWLPPRAGSSVCWSGA